MSRAILAVATAGAVAGSALGFEKFEPVTACNDLITPVFSVDAASPATDPNIPNDFVASSDILAVPGPQPIFPFLDLGLVRADDIDGISGLNVGFSTTTSFVLIFSVDRRTLGVEPPDPGLVLAGFPFNVQNQASRNQAAGDAFMSLELFDRNSTTLSVALSGPASSNTLVINQGDAGGSDFYLDPNDSPFAVAVPPVNNVNGAAGSAVPPIPVAGVLPPPVITYSLSRNSPSLLMLPGTGSGADIYLALVDPNNPTQQLYAGFDDLGLQFNDDINGYILFDDGDRVFDASQDQIIFTLGRNSPTSSMVGPGTIFTTDALGAPRVFAAPSQLGLGDTIDPADPNMIIRDNVNALDFAVCNDVSACVQDWAIGTVCAVDCRADLNGNGQVDLTDLSLLLGDFGAVVPPPPAGDVNCDGATDLADLSILLGTFGNACP